MFVFLGIGHPFHYDYLPVQLQLFCFFQKGQNHTEKKRQHFQEKLLGKNGYLYIEELNTKNQISQYKPENSITTN